MTNEVFLDTGYLIALSVESDELHEHAIELAIQLESEQTRFTTTPAVLLELGNALSKVRHRPAAIELLTALEEDPLVEIVPLSGELLGKAVDLFRSRPDKEWGLIDCLSFVVMDERDLTQALTFDKHFEQAGFRALLRDE